MWDDEKQYLFDTLQLKEAQSVLTDSEVRELQELFTELESEEAEKLKKGWQNWTRA